jgi:prepilin-type N-terminal cleavage/methylation domain-containing protein/prepilin-type processing-associated H-X9-DG protein
MHHASSPVRHAFTLIEMLSVVGIIAVLVGLLLPVVSQMRAQAHVVSCTSNQRQILLIAMVYADDNRERLPPCISKASLSAPGFIWDTDFLAPYLAGRAEAQAAAQTQAQRDQVGQVYRCAAQPYVKGFLRPSSYGWNANLGFYYPQGGASPYYQRVCVRMSAIPRPASELAVITEGNGSSPYPNFGSDVGYWAAWFPMHVTPGSGSFLTRLPHRNRAAVGYLDGHVGLVRYEQFSWWGMFTLGDEASGVAFRN